MSHGVFMWTCGAVELGICALLLFTNRNHIAGVRAVLSSAVQSIGSFCRQTFDLNCSERRDTATSSQLANHIESVRFSQFQVLCRFLTLIAFTVVVSIQIAGLSDELTVSLQIAWTFLLWFVLASLLSIFPGLLDKASIDVWYALFMTLDVVSISSWHMPVERLEVWSYWLAIPRSFSALPVKRFGIAVIFNGLHCLHMFARIIVQDTEELASVGRSKRSQISSELINFILVMSYALVVRQLLYTCERLRLEVKNKTIELSAASSLLEGLFDAVVEVDHDLKIMKPSVALASMLLKRSTRTDRTCQATMEGNDLIASFVDAEKERVRQYMSSSHTFPITTAMLDGLNNRVQVELVRVNYRDHSSVLPFTLVGIREVVESCIHAEPWHDSTGFSSREPTRRASKASPVLHFNADTFEVLGMNDAFAKLCPSFNDECFLDDIFEISKHEDFYEFVSNACACMAPVSQAMPEPQEDAFYRCLLAPRGKATVPGDVKLQKLEVLGTLTLSPHSGEHTGLRSNGKRRKQLRCAEELSGSERSSRSGRGTPRIPIISELGASDVAVGGPSTCPTHFEAYPTPAPPSAVSAPTRTHQSSSALDARTSCANFLADHEARIRTSEVAMSSSSAAPIDHGRIPQVLLHFSDEHAAPIRL
eukprot:TRINITY_DN5969_c0_g2_i1.p1 TRINITY_DN5969_c0_g2~~TRINITY_DN5969_c0_g2_i1.p1  ORF type:complete len:649 (+),score=76.63 TRINITY_DN5969_c0_g2_i1:52-1998(+)